MTGKKYRKKPLVMQAWEFPATMTAQADLARELQQHGAEVGLYDYAVQKIAARFQDGANWRWAQAHVQVGKRQHIARVGDMIVLDPVQGWGVVSADVFAATHDEVQAEETYFYGVQVLMGGRWIMMLTSNYGTSLMHRGKWFERKDEAQACAATWSHDTPTRIVRQRRSPAEVCRTALKPAAAGTTESDK